MYKLKKSIYLNISLFSFCLLISMYVKAKGELYIDGTNIVEDLKKSIKVQKCTIMEMNQELMPIEKKGDRFILLIDQRITNSESRLKLEEVIIHNLVDMLKNNDSIKEISTDCSLYSDNEEYNKLIVEINKLRCLSWQVDMYDLFMNAIDINNNINYKCVCTFILNPNDNTIAIHIFIIKCDEYKEVFFNSIKKDYDDYLYLNSIHPIFGNVLNMNNNIIDFDNMIYGIYDSKSTNIVAKNMIGKSNSIKKDKYLDVKNQNEIQEETVQSLQYLCSSCNKRFLIKEHLNRHKCNHINKSTLDIIKSNWKVKIGSKTKNRLNTHNKTKRFVCGECKKIFIERRYLIRHANTHKVSSRRKCEICDIILSSKSCLTNHLKLHENVKPFKCSLCECSFYRKDYLLSHCISNH